ncbi:uncharacterized protein DUF4102 [Nitrospirillum viridazoti]|nr:uncharacterized protein DUF4102 [Nitrospirillum amazonense]
MAKLSARTVASLNTPGMHPDGDGLYLRITETGTKSWIFRYQLQGRRREMGLGRVARLWGWQQLAQRRMPPANC